LSNRHASLRYQPDGLNLELAAERSSLHRISPV